jgi:cytidine deaminase
MEYNTLVTNSLKVRKFAYAPYSKFYVGASLLTKDGKVYSGCNIENSSYSLTMCAERTAIFKAISEGCREFSAIAIVGGYDIERVTEYCYPCGACIQVMTEFCNPNFKVVLYNGKELRVHTLEELFPKKFTNLG